MAFDVTGLSYSGCVDVLRSHSASPEKAVTATETPSQRAYRKSVCRQAPRSPIPV